jgi:hypothetical protein
VHDWLREVGDPSRWWFRPIDMVTEYGLLILLVVGTAYHFTPRAWVDEHFRGWFSRLPGPVIGLVYAALCLLILHLLDGPRANIYFAF